MDAELLARRETELLEKEGSGCRVLLMNDMNEDLSRMYRLFSRIPEGLVPVAEIFKTHITEMGNEKIEQRLARYFSVSNSMFSVIYSLRVGDGVIGYASKEYPSKQTSNI